MIQMQTNLDVADNSGARRVQCIKVLGGSKRKFASVGDIIVVSVKEAIPRGRVKKGDIHGEGDPPPGRDDHPVRPQRGGAADTDERADRHAYLRPGDARIAPARLHEDHFPRAGGPVSMANKLRIKKGDTVAVLTGRDKGKSGEVLRVMPAERRVFVAGVNMIKRHTRPSQTEAGGIIEKEASIHVSNVAVMDPKENKATRVGYRTMDDGRKMRVAKRSGEILDR